MVGSAIRLARALQTRLGEAPAVGKRGPGRGGGTWERYYAAIPSLGYLGDA